MAKKQVKNHKTSQRYSKYKISGDKIERKLTCPKCGPGIFLAEHKNRKTCGKCGYTEFSKSQ
ncbi:MAG: 30S ribosomal protein S27ae [Nanoarchaeota archaeon]|nr:30S ribosomal protein S27ae [Nanoarchaeota archaeon]